jgi:hypothetical protein
MYRYYHTNTLGKNRPGGGGKETSLSITGILVSTEMVALGRPKWRWRDHINLAAGASITSPITQNIRRKCLSVYFNYRTTLWISKTSCNGRFGTGWKVRGIETWWWARSIVPTQTGTGLTQLPVQWKPRLFPGVNRSGGGVDNPLPTNAEVEENVELYLCSPVGL